MFLHMFEVTVPDGDVVHTQVIQVLSPERVLRVRHRVEELEIQECREPGEAPTWPTWAVPPGEEWDDFDLDEG